jgi:hypothetical protein
MEEINVTVFSEYEGMLWKKLMLPYLVNTRECYGRN